MSPFFGTKIGPAVFDRMVVLLKDLIEGDKNGPKSVPVSGYGIRTKNWPRFWYMFVARAQANAFWQWWNFAESRAPAGKSLLRINMDETAVCLFQGNAKGTVFRDCGPPADGEPVQNVTRSKRRTYITHVAFICDRAELQPLMPQVLIGNCATFLQRDWAALLAGCPNNVWLVRQISSWNNSTLCARLVGLLAAALRPHLATLQPVLFLDAYRAHYNQRVVAACHAAGVWPIFVPAKLTWLLQPLDTHAFFAYKLRLMAEYQRRRAETADGQLNVREFLPCVYDAIRFVLQARRWDVAFDADGIGRRQAALSTYAQRQLQLEGPPDVPSTQPSEEQLRLCLPARARANVASFLRPFAPPRALPAARPAAPVAKRLRVALPPRGPAASSGGAVLVARRAGEVGRGDGAVPVALGGRPPRTRAEHRAAAAASSAASR